MNVRHVATVLPVTDPANRGCLSRRLVDAEHEHHSADQMDEQVARHSGSILFPAAPTREDDRIEWLLWNDVALPGIPIEILRREVERGRVLPRSGGIVPAEPSFNQHEIAEQSLRDNLFCLRASL